MRAIAMVHDRVGGETGMGHVVGDLVRAALEQGRAVTLVAAEVEDDLRASCNVIELPAPARRDVAWQRAWAPAAFAAVPAGAIVHGHLAPLAGRADVMTCHHLARAAADHGIAVEQEAVDLDDESYGRRGLMTFVSAFLRDEFERLYGRAGAVIPPAAPPYEPVRRTPGRRLVVGYVGGDDPRKGVDAVRALCGEDDIELLLAGPHADRIDAPGARHCGWVDVREFAATLDVMVAPALFDALPFAVLEALSRATPVVVRAACGLAGPIADAGAGTVWDGEEPLVAAVRRAAKLDRGRCEAVFGGSAGKPSAAHWPPSTSAWIRSRAHESRSGHRRSGHHRRRRRPTAAARPRL